jgi:hypothetical protein
MLKLNDYFSLRPLTREALGDTLCDPRNAPGGSSDGADALPSE